MRLLAGCCWLALSGVEAFQLGSFNLVRPKLASPEPQGACVVHDLDSALSTINKAIITSMKGVIDFAYNGRDIQRFYVLETIARVPYFSYLSCLHLYETLGMRKNMQLMRIHYAEADNELHHLLVMESLGGSDAFADRFVAQHLAFAYYWYCVAVYIFHPRMAYHLSELIEVIASTAQPILPCPPPAPPVPSDPSSMIYGPSMSHPLQYPSPPACASTRIYICRSLSLSLMPASPLAVISP